MHLHKQSKRNLWHGEPVPPYSARNCNQLSGYDMSQGNAYLKHGCRMRFRPQTNALKVVKYLVTVSHVSSFKVNHICKPGLFIGPHSVC